MSRSRLNSVFVVFILIFNACNSECGSPPPVPAISYDFPVTEGDYLVLTARGEESLNYSWSGPDGLSGQGKILELGIVQRRDAGRFLVTASEGDCDGITNQAEIDIIPKPLPCVPSQSSFLVNAPSVVNFLQISTSCGLSNQGNFEIVTEAQEGRLRIEFPTEESPYFNRAYGMTSNPDYETQDEVRVSLSIFAEKKTYLARTSGYLYIRITASNAFEIYLCDLPLYLDNEIITTTLRTACII